MARRSRESTVEGRGTRNGQVRERTIGVVDIGSNTVHLLVGSTNGRNLTPLVDVSEGLSLGRAVDFGGELGAEKLDELIGTLIRFQRAAAEVGVTRLHLLATQAIRTAVNRQEVCEAITTATELPVEVLSPEQEAELAFIGADNACPSIGPQVMVDIGGGSLQIAVGQNGEMWDSVSLPLGAARVADHFLPTDPPTYVEEALLVGYLCSVIPRSLPLADTNVTGVVGTGGTLRRVPPLLGLKTCRPFPADALERLFSLLGARPSEEVAAEFDLKPERARLLLPAIIVLREILRGYDFPPLVISPYGVREGAIFSLARQREK